MLAADGKVHLVTGKNELQSQQDTPNVKFTDCYENINPFMSAAPTSSSKNKAKALGIPDGATFKSLARGKIHGSSCSYSKLKSLGYAAKEAIRRKRQHMSHQPLMKTSSKKV